MTESDPDQLGTQLRIKKSTPLFFGVFVLFSLIIWFGISLTKEHRERGHAFIAALLDEQFEDAFAMCSLDLQQHLVDAEGLRQKTNMEALPESFWWTEVKSRGSDVFLKSSSKTWWSRSSITVAMHNEEGEWRVVRMSSGNSKGRMELAIPRIKKN